MMPHQSTMAPPPPQQQQQYQQNPWMQQPQQPTQYQQPPPTAGAAPPAYYYQQPPPQQQQQYHQQQQQHQTQQQQYGAAAPAQPMSAEEIRSLWIGDLQFWMDESYIYSCFAQTGEVTSVKIIRSKQTAQSEGYGFIEFVSHDAAERNLQAYNGSPMPNSEQNFRLNWASYGGGEKRSDDSPDYTIFVGDLAADVTDYVLQETFKVHYTSVKGAKVVTDRITGRSKGYGFVKFADESEQLRAMSEMNGQLCSTRQMRIGPAANKKIAGSQFKAPYQNSQGIQSEDDPSNTTIFVGNLDSNVTDEHLKQVFAPFGQLLHVKIPVGKRCGFVQFSDRGSAEEAIRVLNGSQLGGQNIRLSWGRSPSNKQQPQSDANAWNGGYYGYTPGYEAYGYAPAAQDPNLYYGGYPGYGNYPAPPQHQQQMQQPSQ